MKAGVGAPEATLGVVLAVCVEGHAVEARLEHVHAPEGLCRLARDRRSEADPVLRDARQKRLRVGLRKRFSRIVFVSCTRGKTYRKTYLKTVVCLSLTDVPRDFKRTLNVCCHDTNTTRSFLEGLLVAI